MKRVELYRDAEELMVADIECDSVLFRTFEFGHEHFDDAEPFERSGFSMPLDWLRKTVEAAG